MQLLDDVRFGFFSFFFVQRTRGRYQYLYQVVGRPPPGMHTAGRFTGKETLKNKCNSFRRRAARRITLIKFG